MATLSKVSLLDTLAQLIAVPNSVPGEHPYYSVFRDLPENARYTTTLLAEPVWQDFIRRVQVSEDAEVKKQLAVLERKPSQRSKERWQVIPWTRSAYRDATLVSQGALHSSPTLQPPLKAPTAYMRTAPYSHILASKLEALDFRHVEWVHRVITPDIIFPDMVHGFSELIRAIFDKPANAGAFEMVFASYIREIWLGELAPPATLDTGEVVDALLADDTARVDRILQEVYLPTVATKTRIELQNLLTAAQFLFGNNFRQYHTAPLDVDLILAVHSIPPPTGLHV